MLKSRSSDKPRVYLETSFWRRLGDSTFPDRRRASRRFLAIARRRFILLSSTLTMAEIDRARPDEVRRRAARQHRRARPRVVTTDARVDEIAEELRRRGGWSRKVIADLTHVAYGIRGRARAIVSWNLAHLASDSARAVVKRYCRDHGLETVLIGTPEEVLRWHAEAIL